MPPLTKLSDLIPDPRGNTHIVAVVVNHCAPYATRGKDYLCRLDIIDDSSKSCINCMLFAAQGALPETHRLPNPVIVKLDHVKIVYHECRAQVQKSPGFSYSFFQPYQNGFDPIDHSQQNGPVLNDNDKSRIDELRDWLMSDSYCGNSFGKAFVTPGPRDLARKAVAHRQLPPSLNSLADREAESSLGRVITDNHAISHKLRKFNKFNNSTIRLEMIECDLFFNCNLQVIGYSEGHNPDAYTLRCIDGSKPPLETLHLNSLYVMSNLSQVALSKLQDYYVDVCAFDNHADTARLFNIGDYIHVSNLHCYTPAGMILPELILHGTTQYNRGMKLLPSDNPDISTINDRVRTIHIPPDPVIPLVALPDDQTSRSLQSSPTLTLYPQQDITLLRDTLNKTKPDMTLYKIRVYVDRYTPDSYAAMFRYLCLSCMDLNADKRRCTSCRGEDVVRTLVFKLEVRDTSVDTPVELYCCGQCATDLLGIYNIPADLLCVNIGVVEKMMRSWCDIHVVSKRNGEKLCLMLNHTTIKPDEVIAPHE